MVFTRISSSRRISYSKTIRSEKEENFKGYSSPYSSFSRTVYPTFFPLYIISFLLLLSKGFLFNIYRKRWSLINLRLYFNKRRYVVKIPTVSDGCSIATSFSYQLQITSFAHLSVKFKLMNWVYTLQMLDKTTAGTIASLQSAGHPGEEIMVFTITATI